MNNWVLYTLIIMLGYCIGSIHTLHWIKPQINKLREDFEKLNQEAESYLRD